MTVIYASWLPVVVVGEEIIEPVVDRDPRLVPGVVRNRMARKHRVAPIAELTERRGAPFRQSELGLVGMLDKEWAGGLVAA